MCIPTSSALPITANTTAQTLACVFTFAPSLSSFGPTSVGSVVCWDRVTWGLHDISFKHRHHNHHVNLRYSHIAGPAMQDADELI